MMLSAESISVCFNKKGRSTRIIDSVSFSPKPNELTLITGRSGSGKTTLINVLAGLLVPSEGQVYYDDTPLYLKNDEQLSAFRCKNIGYIPHGASALASLTVLQNILLPAALAGDDKTDYADKLLLSVGLEKLKNAYPDELSGGELRRLSAARALINSPSVVFADEPTNDLDEENAALLLKLLKSQAEKGAAVIIVTHDSAAFAYADRVFQMEVGRLSVKENEHENSLCRPLVS